MTIMRWDPWKDLVALQERMSRLLEESFGRMKREEGLVSGAWTPAVDIYETESSLVVTAEIPGVSEKDIDVRIENNQLIIKGERKFEKETKEENYHRIERVYGSFYRSFSLPNTVDHDKVKAEYKNGVLKVTLGKKEEVKPKQIKIEVD
ncbi:MAG: Hsp20/alpha crystallin family protein [Candidatus Aminicenantia bacterium]